MTRVFDPAGQMSIANVIGVTYAASESNVVSLCFYYNLL